VQVDTIKDLFANIEENMMNVYTITRRKLKKTIVKRIPESSIEDVAHYGRKAVRHIYDGIQYMQELVATADL
jgi:hypothetical protein